MKPKKILGWTLIIVGVFLILWMLFSSFNIFTGKTEAPEIFKTKENVSINIDSGTGLNTPEDIAAKTQLEMEKVIDDQLKEMIPPEFVSNILNLISWSILAGIIIFGGSIISNIGIKLIRKIQ